MAPQEACRVWVVRCGGAARDGVFTELELLRDNLTRGRPREDLDLAGRVEQHVAQRVARRTRRVLRAPRLDQREHLWRRRRRRRRRWTRRWR